MKSEIYHRLRAYSPEHEYWNIVNGKFSYAEEEAFANAMERAPYSIYRIARAVAIGDSRCEIRFGNLRVPNWAVYENGTTMYEMISLKGSKQPPDPSLFQPPPEYRKED